MVVALRCRGLSDRESKTGAVRFPNRKDTGFRSAHCLTSEKLIAVVDPDTIFFDSPQPQSSTSTNEDERLAKYFSERRDRVYHFDFVFDEHSTNRQIYEETVAPLVNNVKKGFNATCFAYGMTGAGKTYTMMGSASDDVQGLCSFAVSDLFVGERRAGDIITVHASYLEIYNEKIRDLLLKSSKSKGTRQFNVGAAKPEKKEKELDIVEDPERGIFVPNLTEVRVGTTEELELLLEQGNERRTKACTNSNAVSSRSHAILQLSVRCRLSPQEEDAAAQEKNHNYRYYLSEHAQEGTIVDDNGHQLSQVLCGKLSLIDLAGSERAVSSVGPLFAEPSIAVASTERRREGANINKSLLALGNCITVLGNLSNGKKDATTVTTHIPYRDSKLTRLLKESLGGNTRTLMIATISPSCLCYEETLSTLKYATRAKSITKTVRQNTVHVEEQKHEEEVTYKDMLLTLQDEVSNLRTQLYIAKTANAKLGLIPQVTESTATCSPDRLQSQHHSSVSSSAAAVVDKKSVATSPISFHSPDREHHARREIKAKQLEEVISLRKKLEQMKLAFGKRTEMIMSSRSTVSNISAVPLGDNPNLSTPLSCVGPDISPASKLMLFEMPRNKKKTAIGSPKPHRMHVVGHTPSPKSRHHNKDPAARLLADWGKEN